MPRPTTLFLALALAMSANVNAQDPAKPAAAAKPAAKAEPAAKAAATANNPLMKASTLQFEAPPFDKLKDTDYQPAIEAGMARQLEEMKKIADNPEPPTFQNTLEAMERSGTLLGRSARIFFALTAANTNDTLQKAQQEIAPKLAAHNDAITLDPKLFARVKAVYDKRDALNLDPESKRLVERYHRSFVRSGANLNDADKERLKALNTEESKLTTQFSDNLLKDTNDSAVVVENKAELDGLTDAEIAAAAAAAKDRKLEGKWLLPLQNTSNQPVLASLKNRSLRERVYKASISRGTRGNAVDNKAIVARLAELRAERGKIMGFKDYASFVLDDNMAKTPDAVTKLLSGMAPAAVKNAKAEAAKMQATIDQQKGGFQLAAWDWNFYSDQVRKADFDLDDTSLKPYFELERVLNDGVFYAANKLYGLKFKPRKDIPTYHPDVRAYEVQNEDGTVLAIWYGDFYARPSKRGGAWCSTFVDQSALLGQKPVVFNVANYVKPAAGEPTLLTLDEITTLFHEFGHALHAMFSNVRYPYFAGTSTPRDFVEFPSQVNENWALLPEVLPNYAKHWKTGEPMPQALADKIRKSSKFNQGYATSEYLGSALLDMDWHTIAPGAPKQDVMKFEDASLKKYGLDYAAVAPRYRTPYFAHVWGGGYAAGYYSYIWSEILDADAYEWFKENGGMTRKNGQRFRDMVLSRGGSDEAMSLYVKWRGREPTVDPLLERRGLK
jgi:peptidyl-dipeptidase Dcp